MTGMDTSALIPSIMSGSLIRETPPWARMSAGTRSSAMTATAPASSAMRACAGVTTSMITPPLSISAMPRLTRAPPTERSATCSERFASGWLVTRNLTGRTSREPHHGTAGYHPVSGTSAGQAARLGSGAVRLAPVNGHQHDPRLSRAELDVVALVVDVAGAVLGRGAGPPLVPQLAVVQDQRLPV